MNTVQQNAAVASGRPDDKAIAWIQKAADKSIPMEELEIIPKEFRNLSRECAAKFQSIATGELGRNITQIVEEWLKKGRTAPALVLLRTIVNYYDTGSAPGILYNILILYENGTRKAFPSHYKRPPYYSNPHEARIWCKS